MVVIRRAKGRLKVRCSGWGDRLLMEECYSHRNHLFTLHCESVFTLNIVIIVDGQSRLNKVSTQ